jgi:hypothetical protein
MEMRSTIPFKKIFTVANFIFCALFVLLRQPASAEYLRDLDEARATDSIFELSE